MRPYLADPDVTLYLGDALAVLRDLPDESVHCIATSPPFYALRDYGVEGQIGLEATPDEWAARLVEVFREARRVLRKDGTLWVECGDSYATSGGQGEDGSSDDGVGRGPRGRRAPRTPKPKDLLGTPWLLAFALRADGWWLRGCNIWSKSNAMPESAKDRCTTAHSYVFHLSKSARYYFDAEAVAEPADWERWGDQTVTKHEGTKTSAGWIPPRKKGELVDVAARWDSYDPTPRMVKHPRSVWNIPTQGFPEAHFATWPEALARRIILAGCPEWVCSVCSKPWTRLTDVERDDREFQREQREGASSARRADGSRLTSGTGHRTIGGSVPSFRSPRVSTLGWEASCGCAEKAGRSSALSVHGLRGAAPGGERARARDVPEMPGVDGTATALATSGTVLDPFAGSGTTMYVARKLARRSIGIDLNAEYLDMAARRLAQQSLLAEGVA